MTILGAFIFYDFCFVLKVSPGKSNSSMTEFQKFRNVLELNVKRAENIRAERHLR